MNTPSRKIIKKAFGCLGRFVTLVALVVAALLPRQALAVALNDIGFSALPGGKVQVRLDFDGPPPQPKGYTIEKPARIALDFPGVNSLLKQKKHALSFGNAQSVVVLESAGRTRVIVNLVELTDYKTKLNGNQLLLEVGNDGTRDYIKPSQSSVAQAVYKGPSSASITNVDFQRGELGEGKIVLQLSNPKVNADVVQEGRTIRVSLPGTALPEQFRRRLDVKDFATPVQIVDVDASGATTRIVVQAAGEYDYMAYQVDDTFVVSVKPLTKQEVEEKKKEFAYNGEKLSLNFQDIDVRAVLQLIADFTNLNLVASDTVTGKITLRLQNVPWDQALDLVLKTKGLDKRQNGNVLMVAPAAEIAERERQEIETRKQLEELAPLQTEYIRIQYANARELFKLFEEEDSEEGDKKKGAGSTGSILSPRGRVIVDERTNSLLVTETADRLEEFRRLVALIDIPVRQVLIEARIVIASSDFSKRLGVRWGGGMVGEGKSHIGGITGGIGGLVGREGEDDSGSLFFPDDEGRQVFLFPEQFGVDMGVSDQAAGKISIGVLNSSGLLALELSALEADGAGEVVSQPKVVTGDKQKALIRSGQEVPYLESSSSGRTTVKFKEAVLKLEVTPNITPDGRVIMDLNINQDSINSFISGEAGSQVPVLDVNSVSTRVLVANGETVVLGGVFRTEELQSESKVPFLGDLPYIGKLFKTTSNRNAKNELLIFITPRVLADTLVD